MSTIKVNKKEYAEKWGRRLKGATEDIRRGIDRVDRSPTEVAAENLDKMVAKLLEAIESGRVERGLRSVSLNDWKKAAREKGVPRIAAGVDGATPKMEQFAEWLLPRIEEARAKIEGMPSVTLEDNLNRVVTYLREMGSKKYK